MARALCLLLLLLVPSFGQTADLPAPAVAEADTSWRIHSWESADLQGAEISALLDYPFPQVRDALSDVASWCEFIPLVFNIKACTYRQQPEGTWLTFFIGRKFHHSASQAIRLRYRFQVRHESPTSSHILLFAREGPHGTRDYLIELQARATGDGRTSLLFHSSFRSSWRSRVGTRAYLSGAGRDKIGFSIVGYEQGEPVYVRGVEGIIERNTMRYYLALQAYLDTLPLPEAERFEARLHAWFAATEEYPRQLHEMDWHRYLEGKRMERESQLQRQRLIEETDGGQH
jgi:hypothetical protein